MNGDASFVERLGAFLFRARSGTPVPLALSVVLRARPRKTGVAAGLALALGGLALRLWAVAHVGPESRTRRTAGGPAHLASGGPYAILRHPIYVANGFLSGGLVVASGAGRPWLPVLFPLLWLAQYGPIIRWEEGNLRRRFGGMTGADSGGRRIVDRVGAQHAAPLSCPGCGTIAPVLYERPDWRAAWRSERRTRQAVLLFAALVAAGTYYRSRRARGRR